MIPNRCFGVEMESHPVVDRKKIASTIRKKSSKRVVVTGWRQTHENSNWHVKTDSTCGGGEKNGWEIVSYKAMGDKDVEHISEIAEQLDIIGLRCGVDCGFHVHVDISDFSPDQAAIMVARWIKIEKIMMQSVPSFRRRNRHCRGLEPRVSPKKSLYDPVGFWQLYSPKNFSLHNNRDKRVTMNLVNYATCLAYRNKQIGKNFYCDSTRSTVEFRFPEGTFKKQDVKNWILLFVSFVEYSKKSKMPQDLCSVLSFDDLFNILGLNDFQDCKVWFLDRILKNSRSSKWIKSANKMLLSFQKNNTILN